MTQLLIVSNGHGEDFIAARLAEALRARLPELELAAFPLVGLGAQLQRAGVALVGPRRRLPADGFTFHHPRLLWQDLRAGLLGLTLAQASFLRRARPDAVLVVGDVYAQLHASLVPAPRRVLQPLVSAYHQQGREGGGSPLRYFMESFRAPELALLRRADRVYARDAATAEFLRGRGVRDATWLGNPMMDGLAAAPLPGVGGAGGEDPPVVALLPGSRDQAVASVSLMTRALERLPRVHGLVAWTHARVPAPPPGWEPEAVLDGGRAPVPHAAPTSGRAAASAAGAGPTPTAADGVVAAWRRGERRLWWVEGRFAAVLATADAALGTAGTANEQAVGLGLPVVAFEVPPLYGRDYLRNQARLLGAGLLVAAPTPEAVARQLERALRDPGVRAAARAAGAERMGPPGASAALADDLAGWLAALG